MEKTLAWILNNKIIVFLSLLSFCLFVSTLALAGQRNRAVNELEELRNSLTTEAPDTTVSTTLAAAFAGQDVAQSQNEALIPSVDSKMLELLGAA